MSNIVPSIDSACKQCSNCLQELPATPTHFRLDKRYADGLKPICIGCEHSSEKQCSKCKEWKPATPEFFHRHRSTLDGLHAYCKNCCIKPKEPPKQEKQCKTCQHWFSATADYFRPDGRANDGWQASCKGCEHTAEKQCFRCKEWKPATAEYFHVKRSNPDGLYTYCKVCNTKPKEPVPENPQKQCQRCEQWFPATPEYFNRSKSGRYGIKNVCKTCRNNARRKTPLPEPCPEGYQRCTQCNKVLPATKQYFHANRIVKDGLQSHCKTCVRKHQQEYSKRPEVQAMQKAKRQTPEYRKHSREKNKQWRQDHPDEARMQRKARQITRRSRLRNLGTTLKARDIRAQYQRQRGRCYYCKKKLGTGKHAYHIDHIVPLSKGGTNEISNIVIACPSCNMQKLVMFLHEWIEGGRLL